MPPFSLIVDMVVYTVLPAFVTAAVLTAAVSFLAGPKFGAVASGFGFAAGVAVGQWVRGVMTLMPGDSTWNLLPWAALAALVVGLVLRLPPVPWLLRPAMPVAAAPAIAWFVIPESYREQAIWLMPAFAMAIAVEWAVLETLAERSRNGDVPLAFAASFFAAGLVLIYIGSARLMDVATVCSAALAGVALVAWRRSMDAGGAVPSASVLLSGLLLIGQQETFSEAPWIAFVLVALAPLMLVLSLFLKAIQGFRLTAIRLSLVAGPLAAALLLVRLAVGPLEFE